jgi:site-specific recombinase XerD
MNSLPLIDAFLSYLVDERHFSPYTARCYGADLRQYVGYLVDEFDLTVDPADEEAEARRRLSGAKSPDASGTAVVGSIKPTTVTGTVCEADVESIRGFLAFLNEQSYSPADHGPEDRHAPLVLQVGVRAACRRTR